MEWKGKYGPWALVTGASSGLGAEFVRQLSAKGLNVVLVARRQERMQELAAEVQEAYTTQTRILPVDLTSPGACEQVAEQVSDLEMGLLVNNAGYGMLGAYTSLDSDGQAKMTVLNCVVPVMLTNHFLPPMVSRGRGGLIFLGSSAAFQATPYFATYGATKAFNLMLGEALRIEYRKAGVDSLAVCPGFTRTEFADVANVQDAGAFRVSTPPVVVRLALDSLGRKPFVMPGLTNKVGRFLTRLLPRSASSAIAGAALKGRAKDQ
jgi:uncharacterized protein